MLHKKEFLAAQRDPGTNALIHGIHINGLVVLLCVRDGFLQTLQLSVDLRFAPGIVGIITGKETTSLIDPVVQQLGCHAGLLPQLIKQLLAGLLMPCQVLTLPKSGIGLVVRKAGRCNDLSLVGHGRHLHINQEFYTN